MVISIGIHKMFISHDLINKLLIAKEHLCNVCESVCSSKDKKVRHNYYNLSMVALKHFMVIKMFVWDLCDGFYAHCCF